MTQNLQLMPRENNAISTPSESEFAVMMQQSKMLVATGFLPKAIDSPEKAMAIILTGRELGIPTMCALRSIDVIQGKPTVSPQLMMALIERSGQLENKSIRQNEKSVTCVLKRRGREAHTETFGFDEAKGLGLDQKENYKKQPFTMFRWRAIASCARVVFPDVILGLYIPDEMGADALDESEIETIPANRIEQIPAKTELIQNVKPLPSSTAAPETELTDSERAIRDEGKALLEQFGTNSDLMIAKFNSAAPDKRVDWLTAIRRKAIKEVIASDDWGYSDEGTVGFLAKHGIEAIDTATGAQIERCTAELRELGNL